MRSKAAGLLAVAAFGAMASLGAPVARAAGPSARSARTAGRTPPALDATAVAMSEASTGQELYGVGATRELAIASATKIMTALITLQHARLNQVFTEPAYYPAPADSQIGLVPGERMTVHDLLVALLLPSADDAAEDLASGVGRGSISRFVGMMNVQARRLGLRHTHYSTPIGLDTPGNYSSASDLVALTRYVMRAQPFFRHVVALPRATVRIGAAQRVLTNLNTLVGSVPWVNGVKTGHTLDAGYVLVGSGTRHGLTLITAVLGAPSEAARESETLTLLQYGFATFRLVTPVRAGTVWARPAEGGYSGRRASLIAEGTFTRVFSRTSRIRVLVRAPKQVTGPLAAHAVIGSLVVLAGGRREASIPLLLRRSVPAPPAPVLGGLGPGGITLVLLGLLLIAVGFVLTRRRKRRQGSPEPTREPAA